MRIFLSSLIVLSLLALIGVSSAHAHSTDDHIEYTHVGNHHAIKLLDEACETDCVDSICLQHIITCGVSPSYQCHFKLEKETFFEVTQLLSNQIYSPKRPPKS